MTAPVAAVVFDLDGILIDSEPIWQAGPQGFREIVAIRQIVLLLKRVDTTLKSMGALTVAIIAGLLSLAISCACWKTVPHS